MENNTPIARLHLNARGLRYEGPGNGWSAVVEDGRRVYGETILELHNKVFGE